MMEIKKLKTVKSHIITTTTIACFFVTHYKLPTELYTQKRVPRISNKDGHMGGFIEITA